MRKLVSGFVGVFLVAGIMAMLSPAAAAAGVAKPCWAHLDNDPLSETFGQQVAVWALGGGHDKHAEALLDELLGETETRVACEELFAASQTE